MDQNGNGLRDPGEPGLGGVVVSDQVEVVKTGSDGGFRIERQLRALVDSVRPAFTVDGYRGDPPAPTTITVRGKTSFRHTVSNAAEIIARLKVRPYDLALGGHMHVRELLRFEGSPIRFYQAAAVVGPSEGGGFTFPSGVTVYQVRGGKVDEGRFLPLSS